MRIKASWAAAVSVAICLLMPVCGHFVVDDGVSTSFPTGQEILWLNGIALFALAFAPILKSLARSLEFKSGVRPSFYLRSTAPLMGLILTAVTDQMAWVVAYSVAALFGTLMNWPKREL